MMSVYVTLSVYHQIFCGTTWFLSLNCKRYTPQSEQHMFRKTQNTGLLKMIVGVLTTCHTQYTWGRSICIFLYNRTTLQMFVTYLTGALYVHPLWFYKYQHDNRVCSKLFVACWQGWFQWRLTAILVECAPSREMLNYCTPHIIKENWEFLDPSVQLHTAIASVLCMTSC